MFIRIISGRARGRRLQVPASGVRPTADRVREALFSALEHRLAGGLEGRAALDLFAGAGGLGLEAASRGAAPVVLVERDRGVAGVLRRNVEAVGGARLVIADVARFLAGPPSPFDVVFMDPPYDRGLVAPTLRALAGGWLAAGALICVERPSD